MKRFWAALLLLAVILGGCAANASCVRVLTSQMTAGLRQAQALALLGQWEHADTYTRSVRQTWDRSHFYWEVCLSHGHRDQVAPELARLSAQLQRQDLAAFFSDSEALLAQLDQLRETEQLSLANIL